MTKHIEFVTNVAFVLCFFMGGQASGNLSSSTREQAHAPFT